MTYERRRPDPSEEPRMSALSNAVRARREELGLRQAEVADLAGCSQRFLHTVEHGKPSLRLDKVLDVLEALGLALEVVPGRGEITSNAGGGSAASPSAANDEPPRAPRGGASARARERSTRDGPGPSPRLRRVFLS